MSGAGRDRTDDICLAKAVLYQLSYSPVLVGLGGFEPPTSRLSGVRSNQLSYWPSVEEGSLFNAALMSCQYLCL